MIEEIFENLIKTLSSLPGIGKKSAYRISFHLLKKSKEEFRTFIQNLTIAKENLKFCEICFGFSTESICKICSSNKRKQDLICVVEQAEDIYFIENTGEFQGIYHVLNGVISPLDNIGPDDIRIQELFQRINLNTNQDFEILLATNPTLEGDATADFIHQSLKKDNIKITRLAYGIAVGSSIELADKYTLTRAIRSRANFP